jgi:hypothetical protein
VHLDLKVLEAHLPLIELRLGQLLPRVDLLGAQVVDLSLQFCDIFVCGYEWSLARGWAMATGTKVPR